MRIPGSAAAGTGSSDFHAIPSRITSSSAETWVVFLSHG
jgi:hypothetical protein